MPEPLLITPDTRRRLQERYTEAMRLVGHEPSDFARVHELLAECVRTDPENILYVDALLANLRRWEPRGPWYSTVLGWANTVRIESQEPAEILRAAPESLLANCRSSLLLRQLASAAGECYLDEIELRYLFEARWVAPEDSVTLLHLARALTHQGRFEDALDAWQSVLASEADRAEASRAILDLRPNVEVPVKEESMQHDSAHDVSSMLRLARELASRGQFNTAEQLSAQAQQASGGDLSVLAEREDLRLAHSQHRMEIARRRAASDAHPKAQALVGRLEQEHNRLEIDIFHLRSERHPDDAHLRLELARRLKRAGNYSGAIQRLDEARGDASLAAEVNLELGECWQHLRQFARALELYRQAASMSDGDHRATLAAALYRIGVLAAAMNEPEEAKAALVRLVAIEPDYKDARERLDNMA